MNDPILWSLIAIQVAMGAFDTLVHHEGTERLAWRPSQRRELQLHGVRNFFYAVIFLTFAWIEPHGVWTMILAGILIVEVLITLWDFVEEDLTRKLPGTERINHTLLALNYGAILALAAPILWTWSQMPTALLPANYGWWSVFATLSALGVGIFSLRDLLAAQRSERLDRGDPARLVDALPPRQKLLITGGTGFIGNRLVKALVAAGHDVTVLTRFLRNADSLAHPVRVITTLDAIHAQDRFDAIINLAGDPVANGLWTQKKRARIIASRVQMTRALDALIDRLNVKPRVVISGSAVGYYGLQGDQILAEDADPKPAFVHDVCKAWEESAAPIARHGVRLVVLRIGLVLGVEGGMLARLLTPFEFGGGGVMGSGQQWMPWIAYDDMIRVIAFAIADDTLEGPVNATAPNPVRNVDFTGALAKALHRPAWLRIPAWAIGLLGDMGRETMLGGQRVVPAKLTQHGFVFDHEEIAPMLARITGSRTAGADLRHQASVRVSDA
ncbi:TIGR01777 family oxidoreductase [Pseudaestuariivita rosea]|uniref:TIGR01777 family oxidoreductase n=1 Tax=Pseudaestuariivita rosea TaxID=2763263 RepID=UPI00234FDDF3|nr:TIGR01777 family oxidoreductase [Pseudaestuariivita rosea]